jgi:hypothetical protein
LKDAALQGCGLKVAGEIDFALDFGWRLILGAQRTRFWVAQRPGGAFDDSPALSAPGKVGI